MLTSITLKNFKSYREASLPLAPLTVLIGANASGKSNAIEGLRLLAWLAQGHRLSSIQYAVQDSEKVIRGRVQDLGYHEEKVISLGCGSDLADWDSLSLSLELRGGELHIVDELVAGPGTTVPLYHLDQPSQGNGTDVRVAYNNFARGGIKPHLTASDQFAVFTQLESAARFEKGHQKAQRVIPDVTGLYRRWLENVLFLDPVPVRMRDYSFPHEKRLLGDGSNLSSILYGLWGGNKVECSDAEQANRTAILGLIQSLPEQDIHGLGFIEGPRGEVMVNLVESFGAENRKYDASLLSDGTLRVLAIAAAMLSAEEESLVVIEEIDNGVHPSRAHHLLERIREIAERRFLRVLLSTHNPALLDALPDRALPDVVFCYRHPEDGSSRLIRLESLEDYPELLAQDSLGRLMTTGMLERFVKSPRGGEERRRRAMEWLAQARASA